MRLFSVFLVYIKFVVGLSRVDVFQGGPNGINLPAGNNTLILNAGSTFYLQGDDPITQPTSKLHRYALWNIEKSDDMEYFMIRSTYYDACIDVDSDYTVNDVLTPQLGECTSRADTQRWAIDTDQETKLTTIRSVVLDTFLGFRTVNGSSVELKERKGLLQEWMLLPGQLRKDGTTVRIQLGRSPDTFTSDDDLIWPNELSNANSDDYLIKNHDKITQMQPRVLVLNYLNDYTLEDIANHAQMLALQLNEGSRYHGYNNRSAPAFLNYIIDKVIGFYDDSGSTLSDYQLEMSSRDYDLPHQSWDTSALFNETYADYYGYKDPINPMRNLSLCEMFERGYIHEVWIGGWPVEFLSRAPRYDSNLKRGNFDRCAGNACFLNNTMAGNCNVTVRFHGMDLERGPGCGMHSHGHGQEHMRGVNKYFKDQSTRFFNENLNETYSAPFSSLYQLPKQSTNCPSALTYLNESSVLALYSLSHSILSDEIVSDSVSIDANSCGDERFILNDIWQGCGNVHHAPNSRFQYDADADTIGDSMMTRRPVLNTCENYGLRNDQGIVDLQTTYTYYTAKTFVYDLMGYNDCEGGWNVYMRQSMPGLNNVARSEVSDEPMKNWWPFLFY